MEEYYEYIINPPVLRKIRKLDWRTLWIRKNDYIDRYYSCMRQEYKIIDESIDYYITMAEMSIYYLKNYDNYYEYNYIQHTIILVDNFFNEEYLKYDIKERDFAEYLKYLFLKNNYDIEKIYNLLENSVDKINYDLVVARLLFPSYYYFYLEKFLLGEDNKLLEIVKRTTEYENYIKKIVDKINECSNKKIVLPF